MVNDPFNIVDEIPRKAMTLFYLVDTSGSMSGAKIEHSILLFAKHFL